MTQVTIVTGCAGTGKTERLLEDYRVALDSARTTRRPGTTLWLVPNQRTQKAMTRDIIARCRGTCFVPNVLTFDLFAEKILEAAGRPATPISPVMKRLLLRRIAASLLSDGELQHFQSIAATTGFLDTVSSFISELKREEIWPDRFISVCQGRKSAFAQRDRELGLIYDRYQQHLAQQNWYDNEGRFWMARTKLSEGIRGQFADVRFLAVDGFADFTQTQYEILGYFAAWIEQIAIALPLEQPISRRDLFSKPLAAIDRIRRQLPDDTEFRVVRLLHGPTPTGAVTTVRRSWPKSIGVIADRLFSNPRDCSVSKNAEGLEIIHATGQAGEWEAVARRIKSLLAQPVEAQSLSSMQTSSIKRVRPQDIVVGLRSISADGPRLRDYLIAAGLPVWCEAELPFTSSSIVKAVMLLLQLELDNWPFERVMDVLDSNYFQVAWPEWKSGMATRAVAAALRRLQVHSGREAILSALKRHSVDVSVAPATRHDSLAETARMALALLTKLSRTLEPLRRPHTLADWADALGAIVDELGWTRQAASAPAGKNDSRDLDLFQRILRTAAEAEQKLAGSDHAPKSDLAGFAAELRDLLSHETLQSPIETGGCLRILSVEQIRNLDVPHLFLIGLTEDSFPSGRHDDCLFSEFERQDFILRGITLSHRSRQHADEMFLFYSIVTRARRSLTLSYPAVNSKGQPVFPSPYVTALTSLFDPDFLVNSREGQLNPVPATDRALTLTDVRLAAMQEARHGHPGLFRAVLEYEPSRRAAVNTLAAANVAVQRFHESGFTGYEGQLNLPQNLAWLSRRFGAQHQFSATELESYARCPFQFWLSTVLKIDPVESPEEQTDYALRGNLLHEVLARLLTEGAIADPTVLRTRFLELVDEQLGRGIPPTALRKALLDIERTILSEWADAFVDQQSDFDAKVRDHLIKIHSLPPEIPFGSLPDAPASENTSPPIKFGIDANSVKVRGRIDRVDVGSFEGQPAYIVVDYKTGHAPSSTSNDLISGRSIQLALYVVAMKRLGLAGPDAIPFQMGYWILREEGFKHVRGKFKQIEPAQVQHLETVLDRLLPQLAAEIRLGRFVVENEDPNCTGRCPYRTVCRVNQLRPLAGRLKKQSPPRSDPSEVSDAND